MDRLNDSQFTDGPLQQEGNGSSSVADPDPQHFRKTDPDPHYSQNPDPYQSQNSGAVEAHKWSHEGPRTLAMEA